MIRRPPRTTRTDTLVTYAALVRSPRACRARCVLSVIPAKAGIHERRRTMTGRNPASFTFSQANGMDPVHRRDVGLAKASVRAPLWLDRRLHQRLRHQAACAL